MIWELSDSALLSSDSLAAARAFLYLHRNFWPAALLAFLVIILHSIRTSHRIAGPLFRFRQVFEAVKMGVIPAGRPLRKEDFLHFESHAMNEMLESLRLRIIGIQEVQAGLCRSIEECLMQAEVDSDSVRRQLPDLMEKGNRLAEKVGEFKV